MIHLDRLISTFNPSVSSAYSGGNTTWTLPHSVPVDGSEGTLVIVSGDEALAAVGTAYTAVRNAANTITVNDLNLTIFEMFIGVAYTMTVELSTLYPQKDLGRGQTEADTRGKLQLRGIQVNVSHTDQLSATVTQPERTAVVYVASADELELGEVRVPVLGNNEHTTITLSSLSTLGCRLDSLDWEGFLHVRNFPR